MGVLVLAGACLAGSTGLSAAVAQTESPPVDDPLYGQQHHLPIIRAPEAWEITRGSAEISIAVVDTGVSPDHPDLAGAFLTDRWGNAGYDYLRRTTDTYASGAQDWHGTAVAGVAAARADDGIGIAGVAPQVSVTVRRILASDDAFTPPQLRTTVDTAVRAIRDAAADGADVILLTWGFASLSAGDRYTLRTAIAETGVPVVTAAGNGSMDLSARSAGGAGPWPARFNDLPNMVTVAASDRQDRLWFADDAESGTNYGRTTVDLAAPGDGIWAPDVGFEQHDWFEFEGTSFAAPQVAGALALGRSIAPTMSANELVGEVIRSVTPSELLQGQVVSGGVLDVAEFLRNVQRRACTEEVVNGGSSFSDVNPDGAHAFNIRCAAHFGIAEGTGNGRFSPGANVTRGQMASFLVRTLQVAGHPAAGADAPDAFPDDDGTAHEVAINRLAAAGIAGGGTDGRFRPSEPVTRAQMAAFLVRLVDLVVDSERPPSRDWFDDAEGAHAEAILAARELGITLGTTEPRRFEPGLRTRRDHMASFISRTLEVLRREGVDLTPRG